MHKRGVRVLPGGDYGFAWAPHGTNAMDLQYFVRHLGMTPMEALVSATSLGGQIMLRGNELGEIKDGYLADLLLVDGDPLADLGILLDRKRLLAIMKDGVFHKAPEIASARTLRTTVAA
jgi:imidazolonepropionase-like amidohydrolase